MSIWMLSSVRIHSKLPPNSSTHVTPSVDPRAVKDPQVLQQEGWHYEFNNGSKELSYKGVVYNEMKGVYSSPDALMGRLAQQSLFPDNTYHVDSGGDPSAIPALSFDQFVSFHSSTYHPSNARAYFYGNDDLTKRLDILDSYYSDFQKISTAHTQVALQSFKNLTSNGSSGSSGYHEMTYPSSGGDDLNKRMFTINWLLNEKFLSSKERMKLNILNHLLIGTTASDLYKLLIDSQLGESVTGGGLSEELQQATYSIGMKGVNVNDLATLEKLIENSFLELSQRGFSEDAIASSLNTIEFSIREFNTGGYPKGLSFMLEALNHWIYDQDPLEGLQFEQSLQEIKQEIHTNKFFFQELISKYFLKNSHVVKIVMKPEMELEEKRVMEEKEKMKLLLESMSEKEVEAIQRQAEELRKAQEAEDSLEAKATIPRLALEDLDREEKDIPTVVTHLSYPAAASGSLESNSITVLEHDLPSSGILYSEIGFDFSQIPLTDLQLLSIFSNLLTDSGTKTRDEVSLSRYIGTMTGGIDVSWYTDLKNQHGAVSDPNDVLLYLMIGSKCTVDKIPEMYEIIGDLLTNCRLDNQKKALEMLLQSRSRRVNSVSSSGHRYAAKKLLSNLSFLGFFNEQTGGLSYLQSLDELIDQATNNWEEVHQRLEKIRETLLFNLRHNAQHSDGDGKPSEGKKVIINLTGDKHLIDAAKPPLATLFSQLDQSIPPLDQSSTQRLCPSHPSLIEQWKSSQPQEQPAQPLKEGVIISSQVNYVTKGGSIYQPGEHVKGSTAVVAKYLSGGYLWDMVRVIGGAYGGFGSFSATSGRYVFSSYRDPNILETLETYDASAEHLLNSQSSPRPSAEAITQSIIATFGDLDSPLFVDQKGDVAMKRYLRQETHAERQQWREEILSTTSQDFVSFGSRLQILKEKGGVVVFGSKASLEAANQALEAQSKEKFVVRPAFLSTNGSSQGEDSQDDNESESE
jgi:presequence protease